MEKILCNPKTQNVSAKADVLPMGRVNRQQRLYKSFEL